METESAVCHLPLGAPPVDRMGLGTFFNPRSIVLIGATDREGAAGAGVLENILRGSDRRRIYPVNPKRKTVMGVDCYPSVLDLPEAPELAVVVTPAETVPGVCEDCGKIGVKTLVVIPAGFKEKGRTGQALESRVVKAARKYGMRVIGPNCMGVIRPSAGLNTTFFMGMPRPGNIAFFSQSGALGAGILDWAIRKNIGFSAFISLGSMADVDFADMIDYFGEDPETRSIVIYPESIPDVRKFVSAVRGFARTKPVLILKPGRYSETAQVLRSHTGAMVGEDMHYDAIIRRAGAIRVEEMGDLFNCTCYLNGSALPTGPNLAVITNGGGPAVLATDYLMQRGGRLAKLSKETIAGLDKVLLPNWSMSNPIDLREDAAPSHYLEALKASCASPEVDAIMVIYTPQGRTPVEVAKALIKEHAGCRKPLLAVWIGGDRIAEARQLLHDNNIPVFEFPEEAIRAYVYMCDYAKNLQTLYETPGETQVEGASKHHLKAIARRAVRSGQFWLGAEDTDRFLNTYNISTVKPFAVREPQDVELQAEKAGYPLVMKIDSPDIVHKTESGGVIAGIRSKEEAVLAYHRMLEAVKSREPEARIRGVTLFKMIEDYGFELIVGSKKDDHCGPVIAFGLGGREAEFIRDIAVGLPPLNQTLARRIIEQTRVYSRLASTSRTKPPVNLRALDELLVRVSELIVDFPEIKELDINPLVIKGDRALALDARILIDGACTGENDYSHLVISPYPTRYIQPWRCKDGRQVILRPIRPEDENMEREAFERLSEESRRLRYFSPSCKATHEMLTRFCNIDYDREMVIIAECDDNGKKRSVGDAWLMVQADGESAEFAVQVAEDFRGVGLGLKLVDVLIGIGREKALKTIYGIALKDNAGMLSLAKRLGFEIRRHDGDDAKLVLEL
jgi:acetyltransferase